MGYMNRDSFRKSRQPLDTLAARGAQPFELSANIELRGRVTSNDGDAITKVIETLSDGRIRAEYKAAALYRNPKPPSGLRSSRFSEHEPGPPGPDQGFGRPGLVASSSFMAH